MSRIYDNWEKLVTAVVKKEQIWQLFHEQSRSPSISSESSGFSFSFWLNSSLDSEDFVADFGPVFGIDYVGGSRTTGNSGSSILLDDSSCDGLIVSREAPVQVKRSFATRRKRNLVIEVPKLRFEQQAALFLSPLSSKWYQNPSPGTTSPMNSSPWTTSHVNHATSSRASPSPRTASPLNHVNGFRTSPSPRKTSSVNRVSSSRASPNPSTTSLVNHVSISRSPSPRMTSSVNHVTTSRESPSPRMTSLVNHVTSPRASPSPRTKGPVNHVTTSREGHSPRMKSPVNYVTSPIANPSPRTKGLVNHVTSSRESPSPRTKSPVDHVTSSREIPSPITKSHVNHVTNPKTNPIPRTKDPMNHVASSSARPSPRTKSPMNHVPGSRMKPSPRMACPVSLVCNTRIHTNWPDDVLHLCHPLPLPPKEVSNHSQFPQKNLAATSPYVPRSPGRPETPTSPRSSWKKGKLLDRGTFGNVYLGFDSKTGEMCAMKEVILLSNETNSRKNAKMLEQEIVVLSRLKHPNIVKYYGSETVDDKLYIYSEFVSGGTLHKILQQYGKLGESAIRNYTKQILFGLSYLHSKSMVHRDIKGTNILVDPYGNVKLANSGIPKHIIRKFDPLLFEGSHYWMAPEVARNPNGCSLAVDIWSLGCIILEMATTKPPWSQYKEPVATFKVGYSEEIPEIPDNLSNVGKEFVKLCLQRNPLHRPTAAQLLEHPFMKSYALIDKQILGSMATDRMPVTNTIKAPAINHARNCHQLVSQTNIRSSDIYKNAILSPVVNPVLHSRSSQHRSGPLFSPNTRSNLSTGQTGGRLGSNNLPKNPPGPCSKSPSYWDPDILQGRLSRFSGTGIH